MVLLGQMFHLMPLEYRDIVGSLWIRTLKACVEKQPKTRLRHQSFWEPQTNKPTNQQTNQPTNQPTNKPTNQQTHPSSPKVSGKASAVFPLSLSAAAALHMLRTQDAATLHGRAAWRLEVFWVGDWSGVAWISKKDRAWMSWREM